MIRFCDKEVYCVTPEQLDRGQILKFFLEGHMDDEICLIDGDGKFKGRISYYTLINCENIYDSVSEEYVFFDDNIWTNSRYFFKNNKAAAFDERSLLPVLDYSMRLLCFAYDVDDNRELRMLRELMEKGMEAIQFSDIYPQYKSVKIYEINELAFFFAKYLEKQGIPVQVEGALWNEIFEKSKIEVMNYECLHIYAEGTGKKGQDFRENLLESISAEFECIDDIYEINIRNGIINNADFNYISLLDRLRQEKEIVIIGTGLEAQDTFDYFLGNAIDICCFMSGSYAECQHKLFGKNIEHFYDIRKKYHNPVFIECTSKKSAWGFGGTDHYDYIGYRRNKNFFLLKDYIEVKANSLRNILKGKEILLAGDYDLCNQIVSLLLEYIALPIGWLDTYNDTIKDVKNSIEIPIKEIDKEILCLIVLPEFFDQKGIQNYNNKKQELIKYLKGYGFFNYSDYFSFMVSWIYLNNNGDKYTKEWLRPKRIVIGAMAGSCGNAFFRGLLDGHPSIIMIEYSHLNNNLFWICCKLANEDADNILFHFWELYENLIKECSCKEEQMLIDPQAFNKKMQELLAREDKGRENKFSSQELFIMFHIAYVYMYGRNIINMQDIVIYWEPHMIYRNIVVKCVEWLESSWFTCEVVDIRRNVCARIGSNIKGSLRFTKGEIENRLYLYENVFNAQFLEKEYQQCNKLNIRFEDLKCIPKEVLQEICERWCIVWDDNLMVTSRHGNSVSYDNGEKLVRNFDLGPVFNFYEEYFSEFDRLRLMLYYSKEQRIFGYPYVDIKRFSMKELQQLFLKRFRFEDLIKFNGEKEEFSYRRKLLNRIREKLLEIRVFAE